MEADTECKTSHVPLNKILSVFVSICLRTLWCIASNKASAIIRSSRGPCYFFRYKDRNPSYRLCAVFIPTLNHRGSDWKSVDTEYWRESSELCIMSEVLDKRNLNKKNHISKHDRSIDSSFYDLYKQFLRLIVY